MGTEDTEHMAPAVRPHAVPPAPVPLSFLAAAAAGLVGCGAALAWAAGPA